MYSFSDSSAEGSRVSAEPIVALSNAEPSAGAHTPERERVWLFAKEADGMLTMNFALREFHCGCNDPMCHFTLLDPRLVETLQTIRELVARPLVLNSAFRCIHHNRRSGGRMRSFHTRGMAADIRCKGVEEMAEVEAAARRIPAVGAIGSNPAKGYLHLDLRRRAAGAALVEWRA